jgi:hypothetical protein
MTPGSHQHLLPMPHLSPMPQQAGKPPPRAAAAQPRPGEFEAIRLIEDEGVEAFFSNSFEIRSSTIQGRLAGSNWRSYITVALVC